MGMTSGGGKGLAADINVTPLIDVLLVLLIIFMVIEPTTVHGLDALVPQPPKSRIAEPNPDPIVVQVLGGGEDGVTYKINGDSFRKGDVEPELARIFATRDEKVMFVKGDADLDFSLVSDVIDFGHQAGVDNIGILTRRAGQ